MKFQEALEAARQRRDKNKMLYGELTEGEEVVAAICEQIEANRVAIEELRAERDAELRQRAEMQKAFDAVVRTDPIAFLAMQQQAFEPEENT